MLSLPNADHKKSSLAWNGHLIYCFLFLSATEMTKIISSSFHDFMSHQPVPADQYIPDESFYY